MKYQIVEHHNKSMLAVNVNRLISEGWLPQGGVSFSFRHSDGSGKYAQAMVMRTADQDPEVVGK